MDIESLNDNRLSQKNRNKEKPKSRFLISVMPGTEIIILLLILFSVDYFAFFPTPLHSLQLNPFWVPVVLAAVQYGTGPGLTTAVLAGGLSWLLGWAEPAVGADYYAYLLENLRDPILWLAAVAILGAISQRLHDRNLELEAEAQTYHEQAAALAEHAGVLRNNLTQLEYSAATSNSNRAGESIELLDQLANAPSNELENRFRDTLWRLLGAEGIEIAMFDTGWPAATAAHDIAAAQGQLHAAFPSRRLPPQIVETLRSERRALACVRPADAQRLSIARAAYVAPIPGGDGQPLGAVAIGEIDPSCLTPAGEAAISLCCFILGKRLEETSGGTADQVIHLSERLNVINLPRAVNAGDK
jgi:hypothetical protein